MPRRFSVWVSAFPFLFLLVDLRGPALAQQPSGRAVGVIPDASALRSAGRHPLALQQPVYMGDRIQTGASGEAQIDFVDSTRLVVGPASSLLIDSSVMRNRKTMSSFVVSALRGTFRFISGSSPKPAYAIRTPTATIGVRGTEFDFAVLPDGGTEFVLFKGQAQVCDRSGNCTVMRGSCNAISIPSSGPMRSLLDREERNTRLRANFPYILARNASLRPEFRTDVRTCGNIAAANPGPDAKDPAGPSASAPPAPAPNPPSAPPSRPDPAPPAQPSRPDPVTPAAPAQPSRIDTTPSPPEPSRSLNNHGHGKGDKGGKDGHGGFHGGGRGGDGWGNRNDGRDRGGHDHRGDRGSRDGGRRGGKDGGQSQQDVSRDSWGADERNGERGDNSR